MTSPHRAAATGVALALSLALAGCSGGSGAPDGWTRVQDGWLQVDVPDDWTDAGALDDPWTLSRHDGDDATVELAGAPTLGYYRAAEGRGILLASMQVGGYPDFAVVEQSDPVDSGDLELTRTDFTYAAQDGGDRLEGVLWVGSDPATTKAVAVQLTGPDLPADVVDQVQDSIAVLDTDATPGT
ncbi:hypothetical protein ASD16_02175 [Cellulomonas sp. Root485]|uniref:hypothetical protein n=1 Tax=Cellulomonas sp. Root485 TaxID=1736546 RepID=UPI0006F9F1D3|nr:hypothetical protein [Cellulomonas sp. Root485]KQY24375.1 hypothetical protein ASD16_02175 [Cellulomonas sp. Root485]